MGINVIERNAIAPIITHQEYLKYGFCKTRCQSFLCPTCNSILNAGPNHQPKCCDQCGQFIDFTNIVYEDEEFLGYDEEASRRILFDKK